MQPKDRVIAVSICIVLGVFWLGFLIHRSPQFAGSAWGGLFGVTAALLLLAPLAYVLVKRSARLRRAFTGRFSFQSLLQAHIHLGLVGALLALIHTGHKFQSVLGMALTAVMLLVVISGCVGQYFLRYVVEDIRDKQVQLGALWQALELKSRAFASGPLESTVAPQAAGELMPVATATAELQYALEFQERIRKLFNIWLIVHIVCSAFLYTLLGLHVWAGIHFGLRWFAGAGA